MSEFLELTEDLKTSIEQLNQLLQGDENATVTINGEEKPSVQKKALDTVNAQVQLVLDAAADIDAVKYATVQSGISGTVSGQYFSVVSEDQNSFLDLYKNEAGVAVFKKTYPSTSALLKIAELKNIAMNQNYDDATNIAAVNATVTSIENNVLTFQTTSPYGQVFQSVAVNEGDKYYVSVQFKNSNPDAYLDIYNGVSAQQIVKVNHTGSNKFERLDLIFESTSDATVRLRTLDPRSGYVSQIKEMLVINLTKTFGAGQEPSIDEVRDIINITTNGNDFFEDSDVSSFSDIATLAQKKKNYFVNLIDEKLTVIQKYSQTHDLKLVWQKFYPNYVFNLQKISLIANTSTSISRDFNAGDEIIGLGTDTLGPWRIKAKNNIDGDSAFSNDFTGGSHCSGQLILATVLES